MAGVGSSYNNPLLGYINQTNALPNVQTYTPKTHQQGGKVLKNIEGFC